MQIPDDMVEPVCGIVRQTAERFRVERIEHMVFEQYTFTAAFIGEKIGVEMENRSLGTYLPVEIMYLAGRDKKQHVAAYWISGEIHEMAAPRVPEI